MFGCVSCQSFYKHTALRAVLDPVGGALITSGSLNLIIQTHFPECPFNILSAVCPDYHHVRMMPYKRSFLFFLFMNFCLMNYEKYFLVQDFTLE